MASEFLYTVRPTRPDMLRTSPTEGEAVVIQQHFDYLRRATDAGVVLTAGRTLTTDETSFGIVIFHAESEVDAREFMEADPAVRQGVMRAELFPYRVALLAARWERA
jgi:uncharacterized protein YciI